MEVWSGGAFLAFLLALSRVYVGVHYPFDVVSGVLVALIAFLLVRWQQERLSRVFQTALNCFRKIEDKVLGWK